MRYLIVISVLIAAGCSQTAAPEHPGREIYMGYCVSCHGRGAQGDGVYASELSVAPADLTGLAARNGGVFPSSDVMAKIYGYPGRYQDHVMPEFGPVLAGPNVTWTDETGALLETPKALIDLVEYLKSVQRP